MYSIITRHLVFHEEKWEFFKLTEKPNGDVFRKNVHNKPPGENRIRIKGKGYVATLDVQIYFTNTKISEKLMDFEDKPNVYNIPEKTGFYSMT